jgi:hypothetical protein
MTTPTEYQIWEWGRKEIWNRRIPVRGRENQGRWIGEKKKKTRRHPSQVGLTKK